MRIESSIITSLSELRAIEQQRIADERAALEARRAAEIEVQRALEQARADAERARVQAERDERMRIELAKAEAEREVRLRIEAHEASERARHLAQLEERRLAEEMELKRAEVAKKRPTWMIAVTVCAALAAVGLTAFAVNRSQEMADADAAKAKALHERDVAKAEIREAKERLAAIQKEMDALDGQIVALTTQLTDAQTDADRKKAAIALADANERKAEANRRLQAAKDAAWKKKRAEKVDVTGCTDTALGCLDHK